MGTLCQQLPRGCRVGDVTLVIAESWMGWVPWEWGHGDPTITLVPQLWWSREKPTTTTGPTATGIPWELGILQSCWSNRYKKPIGIVIPITGIPWEWGPTVQGPSSC